jgi:hypothetical protein
MSAVVPTSGSQRSRWSTGTMRLRPEWKEDPLLRAHGSCALARRRGSRVVDSRVLPLHSRQGHGVHVFGGPDTLETGGPARTNSGGTCALLRDGLRSRDFHALQAPCPGFRGLWLWRTPSRKRCGRSARAEVRVSASKGSQPGEQEQELATSASPAPGSAARTPARHCPIRLCRI